MNLYKKTKKEPNRILVLDSLRGLAAIGVAIFCHYRHFSQPFGVTPLPASPFFSYQPFNWLYVHSWLLVDLFFILSGFIFSECYLAKIKANKINAHQFFILRFSRLYPLHFITIFLAAIFFWLYFILNPNIHFPYLYDPFHLLLNIFFMQGGIISSNFSFNAPSWSLSVEVLAYIVFFILATKVKNFIGAAVVVIFIGLIIIKEGLNFPIINVFVARALIGFFMGCLLHFLLNSRYKKITIMTIMFIFLYTISNLIITRNYNQVFLREIPVFSLIIFPAIIILALECKIIRNILEIRIFTYLGEISYSIYLIQLPVQLVIQCYCSMRGITLPVSQPYFLLFYFGLIIVISSITYKFFEVPARKLIRRKYLKDETKISKSFVGVVKDSSQPIIALKN